MLKKIEKINENGFSPISSLMFLALHFVENTMISEWAKVSSSDNKSFPENVIYNDNKTFSLNADSTDFQWLLINLLKVFRLSKLQIINNKISTNTTQSVVDCKVQSSLEDNYDSYKFVAILINEVDQLIFFTEENRYARFIKIFKKEKFSIDAVFVYT